MDFSPDDLFASVSGPPPGSFRWQSLLVWLVCCAVLGLLMAWAAVVARGFAAPLVLFPLMVGAVLGGLIVVAMRVLHVGHRPTIAFGVVLAALLTAVGQHYITFTSAQRYWARQPDRLVKLRLVAPERVPPSRFVPFLAWSAERGLPWGNSRVHGLWAWFVWAADGGLAALAAVALALATSRLPYCDRCGRWYRTVRSGKLPPALADEWTAWFASRQGKSGANPEAPGDFARFNRYRLLACEGACGPTGLVIGGEDSQGRGASRTIWLDAAARERLVAVLDRSPPPSCEEQVPSCNL